MTREQTLVAWEHKDDININYLNFSRNKESDGTQFL